MSKQLWGLVFYNFIVYLRDRLFHGILLLSGLLLVFSYAISNLTIIDNRKVILDFSFSLISLICVALSVFLGVHNVRREIDTRQSHLILSKPVSRRLYVIAKAFSGACILLFTMVILGIILFFVSIHADIILPEGTFSALYLIFLESFVVLAAAQSVALFTSSATLSTIISVFFFIIARSSEYFLVQAEKAEGISAHFFRALYYIIPDLSRYNIRDIVAYAKPFDSSIVGNCTLYTTIFTTGVLVLSAAFFEKRNIK